MTRGAIETKADKLLEYVYTLGEVHSSSVADALGITIDQVEEWAKPLEESQLLGIKYSPVYGMILYSTPLSEAEMSKKLAEFKERKDALNVEEAGLEKAYLKWKEWLLPLEDRLDDLEDGYEEKLKEIESKKSKEGAGMMLDNLKDIHAKIEVFERELSRLREQKNSLNKTIDKFKKDLLATEKRAQEAGKIKSLGRFFDFLAKSERDALDTKKAEDQFIAQINDLKNRIDAIAPKVQATHKKVHRHGLFGFLRRT